MKIRFFTMMLSIALSAIAVKTKASDPFITALGDKLFSNAFASGSGFLKAEWQGELSAEEFRTVWKGLMRGDQAIIEKYWKNLPNFSPENMRQVYQQKFSQVLGQELTIDQVIMLIDKITFKEVGSEFWDSYESYYVVPGATGGNTLQLWDPRSSNNSARRKAAKKNVIGYLQTVAIADTYCANVVEKKTTTGGFDDYDEELLTKKDNTKILSETKNNFLLIPNNSNDGSVNLKDLLIGVNLTKDITNTAFLQYQAITTNTALLLQNSGGGGQQWVMSTGSVSHQPGVVVLQGDGYQEPREDFFGGLVKTAVYGAADGFGTGVGWNLADRIFYPRNNYFRSNNFGYQRNNYRFSGGDPNPHFRNYGGGGNRGHNYGGTRQQTRQYNRTRVG